MPDTESRCPNCQNALVRSALSARGFVPMFNPCTECGLTFIDGRAPCTECARPVQQHSMRCPIPQRRQVQLARSPQGQRVLCPLCGSYRHRKDKAASERACSWRQWAMQTGKLKRGASPDPSVLPDQSDPNLMREYLVWMQLHPNLPAGSVVAERIFRQRIRDHGTLEA